VTTAAQSTEHSDSASSEVNTKSKVPKKAANGQKEKSLTDMKVE